MNKLYWIIVILLAFFSCTEEIEGPDTTFIKIYGREADSQGFGLQRLSDGRLVLLGQTSTAGFDIEIPEGGGIFTNTTVFRSPSITILNESGNLISRKLLPLTGINDLNIGFIDEIDPNTAVLKQIIELDNGGFIAAGEWLGASIGSINVFNRTEVNIPFFIYLDSEFKITSIDLLGLQGSNDFRSGPVMRKHPDGSIFILLGEKKSLNTASTTGFTIVKLNSNGDLVGMQDIIDSQENISWDMAVDNKGDLLIVGQFTSTQPFPRLFLTAINSSTLQEIIPIKQQIGETANADLTLSGSICSHGSGYAIFSDLYPNVLMTELDNGFSITREPVELTDFILGAGDALGEGQFIRKGISANDGGFFVLTEIIRSSGILGEGELLKLNEAGEVEWSYYLDGIPQDILASEDGGAMILYNPQFNELTPKSTIVKISADGKL